MTNLPRKFSFEWSAGNIFGALLALAALLVTLWALARALVDREIVELLFRTLRAALDIVFIGGFGLMLGYLAGSRSGYRRGYVDGERHTPYDP